MFLNLSQEKLGATMETTIFFIGELDKDWGVGDYMSFIDFVVQEKIQRLYRFARLNCCLLRLIEDKDNGHMEILWTQMKKAYMRYN